MNEQVMYCTVQYGPVQYSYSTVPRYPLRAFNCTSHTSHTRRNLSCTVRTVSTVHSSVLYILVVDQQQSIVTVHSYFLEMHRNLATTTRPTAILVQYQYIVNRCSTLASCYCTSYKKIDLMQWTTVWTDVPYRTGLIRITTLQQRY